MVPNTVRNPTLTPSMSAPVLMMLHPDGTMQIRQTPTGMVSFVPPPQSMQPIIPQNFMPEYANNVVTSLCAATGLSPVMLFNCLGSSLFTNPGYGMQSIQPGMMPLFMNQALSPFFPPCLPGASSNNSDANSSLVLPTSQPPNVQNVAPANLGDVSDENQTGEAGISGKTINLDDFWLSGEEPAPNDSRNESCETSTEANQHSPDQENIDAANYLAEEKCLGLETAFIETAQAAAIDSEELAEQERLMDSLSGMLFEDPTSSIAFATEATFLVDSDLHPSVNDFPGTEELCAERYEQAAVTETAPETAFDDAMNLATSPAWMDHSQEVLECVADANLGRADVETNPVSQSCSKRRQRMQRRETQDSSKRQRKGTAIPPTEGTAPDTNCPEKLIREAFHAAMASKGRDKDLLKEPCAEPQAVAARVRRERVNSRMKALQEIVPGALDMTTENALLETMNHIRSLLHQIREHGVSEVCGNGGMKNSVLFSAAKLGCMFGEGGPLWRMGISVDALPLEEDCLEEDSFLDEF